MILYLSNLTCILCDMILSVSPLFLQEEINIFASDSDTEKVALYVSIYNSLIRIFFHTPSSPQIIAFLSLFSVPRLDGTLSHYHNPLSSNERPGKHKDREEKELRKKRKTFFDPLKEKQNTENMIGGNLLIFLE